MPSQIARRPHLRHACAALSAVWIAGAVPVMLGLVLPGDAHAATILNSPAPDLNASARAEVAQAMYAASATVAAAERSADARLTQQRRQIEQLQAQLKTAGGRSATLLADLTRAQERFVEQLAERDRAYAQSIAVFRRAVQDIAATPEGEAALRQFNAGDEVGALAALDRIVDARELARKVQADIETAVERRRVATLALEAMGKGKQRAADVLRRFEEVTRLDPGLHWDWVELGRLHTVVGRLPDAFFALQRAGETATNDRDRAVALNELSEVLVVQGDLAGARVRFQEGLDIAKKLAAADPTLTSLQRDLSVSLSKLGNVLVAQGDLLGARVRYQEGLDIAMTLVAADPTSASLQRDVLVIQGMLGDVLEAQGDLAGALARYQDSSDLLKKLAAAHPTLVGLQRDVSVSLNKLGNVLVAQGDLPAARARIQEGLDIAKKLAAADPSSASLQRDLSVSFNKLGDVLVAQGDLPAARARFQEGLDIAKKLAVADLTSASLQRDVSVSLSRLGDMLMVQGDLAGAWVRYQEGLDIAKKLVAVDPTSTSLKRDLSVSLDRLGDVLMALGDQVQARARYQEGLNVRMELALADLSSAILQRDLIVSYVKLSEVFKDRRYAQQALDVALAMRQRGILAPRDAWMVEDLKRRAGP